MSKVISQEKFEDRLLKKHNGNISLYSDYTMIKNDATFICNICNHIWTANAWSVSNGGNGCPNCKRENARLRYYYPFDKVKEYIESLGYKVIGLYDKEYKNAQSKIIVECPNGHQYRASYNTIQQGHGCLICGRELIAAANRMPVSRIYNLCEEDKLKIEFLNGEYKNWFDIAKFTCLEGHVHERSIQSYIINRGCITCNAINRQFMYSGKNSANWQGGKTILRAFIFHQLTQWKKDSMKNCNYKCVLTGDVFDDIHHLYGLNLIINDAMKELGLDVVLKEYVSDYTEDEIIAFRDKIIEIHYHYPLGVCLREDVHILFHQNYGYGDNTPEQFEEFKQRYFRGEFIKMLKA